MSISIKIVTLLKCKIKYLFKVNKKVSNKGYSPVQNQQKKHKEL